MIVYTDSLDGITAEQLGGFFHGWINPPSRAAHLQLLQNSDYVQLAIDEEANRVVGFITAISDHVITAYIPYVEVLPNYRGKGIGRELTRRMTEGLKDYYILSLMCGMGLQSFYGSFGMTQVSAMMRYSPYASQHRKP